MIIQIYQIIGIIVALQQVFYINSNTFYLDGEIFYPVTVDNPNYVKGLTRVAALVYEAADSYSGVGLLMVESLTEYPVPIYISFVYIIKSVIYSALSFWLIKRKKAAQ